MTSVQGNPKVTKRYHAAQNHRGVELANFAHDPETKAWFEFVRQS